MGTNGLRFNQCINPFRANVPLCFSAFQFSVANVKRDNNKTYRLRNSSLLGAFFQSTTMPLSVKALKIEFSFSLEKLKFQI